MAADLLVLACTVDGHNIHDLTSYEVVDYDVGDLTNDRTTLESKDVPGRMLLTWQPSVMLGSLEVLVRGASAAQIKSRLDTVTGWFGAVDYLLVATVALPATPLNTWVETWRCEPADWTRGALNAVDLANKMQRITFTWPHSPVEV